MYNSLIELSTGTHFQLLLKGCHASSADFKQTRLATQKILTLQISHFWKCKRDVIQLWALATNSRHISQPLEIHTHNNDMAVLPAVFEMSSVSLRKHKLRGKEWLLKAGTLIKVEGSSTVLFYFFLRNEEDFYNKKLSNGTKLHEECSSGWESDVKH